MKKDELIKKLNEVYQGSPWHGSNIVDTIQSIAEENLLTIVAPGEKSIAHLLEHMIAWRIYAIQKLKDQVSYDIDIDSERDWPTPNPIGQAKSYYLEKLSATQDQIITLLQEKNESWLVQTTSNKSYSNQFLIQGIIEHDLYHLGQIGIFNSLLNAQNSSN